MRNIQAKNILTTILYLMFLATIFTITYKYDRTIFTITLTGYLALHFLDWILLYVSIDKYGREPVPIQDETIRNYIQELPIEDDVVFKIANNSFTYRRPFSTDYVFIEPIQSQPNTTAVRSMIAHEIAHLKQPLIYSFNQTFFHLGVVIGTWILLHYGFGFIEVFGLLSCLVILLNRISWFIEYDADKRAAEIIGPEQYKEDLEYLVSQSETETIIGYFLVWAFVSHPPLSNRIRFIPYL